MVELFLFHFIPVHLCPLLPTMQNKNLQFTFIPYASVSIGGDGANYIILTSSMRSATVRQYDVIYNNYSPNFLRPCMYKANITVKVAGSVAQSEAASPPWLDGLIAGFCILLVIVIASLIVMVRS